MVSQTAPAQDLASLNEADLIKRAQDRDEAALSFIWEQNHDRIYRYLQARLGHPEDAEDLTTDVFVKMLNGLPAFQWQGITLTAWLFRIAHNVMVDHLRRRTTRGPHVTIEENVPNDGLEIGTEVERLLAVEELRVAIAQLTDAQRAVIEHRFAGGLSVAETAAALGKNAGTVKVLQYNAVASLRRILTGHPKRRVTHEQR